MLKSRIEEFRVNEHVLHSVTPPRGFLNLEEPQFCNSLGFFCCAQGVTRLNLAGQGLENINLLFSQTALSRSPVEVVVLDDNRLSNPVHIHNLVRCSQGPYCHLNLVSLRNNPVIQTPMYAQIAAQLLFGTKLRLVPSHHQFEKQLLTENNGLLLQEISGAEQTLKYFATLKNYECPEKLKSESAVSHGTKI